MRSPSSSLLTPIRRRCSNTLLSKMFKACGSAPVGEKIIMTDATKNWRTPLTKKLCIKPWSSVYVKCLYTPFSCSIDCRLQRQTPTPFERHCSASQRPATSRSDQLVRQRSFTCDCNYHPITMMPPSVTEPSLTTKKLSGREIGLRKGESRIV